MASRRPESSRSSSALRFNELSVATNRSLPIIDGHNRPYLGEWAANYGQEAEFVQRGFPEMIRFFASAGYALEPPFVSPDFQAGHFLSSGASTKWSK